MAAEENVKTLSFSIQGEFITQLARERCYYDGEFNYSMELLLNSMVSDTVPKNEIRNMALAILDGRAELKGNYPDGDYSFVYLDEKNNNWDLGNLIKKLYSEAHDPKKEYEEVMQKYLFILDNIDDSEKYRLSQNYKDEYEEDLFD